MSEEIPELERTKHNEKVRLKAQFFNSLSLALFAVMGLGSVLRFGTDGNHLSAVIALVVASSIAVVGHHFAASKLDGLK